MRQGNTVPNHVAQVGFVGIIAQRDESKVQAEGGLIRDQRKQGEADEDLCMGNGMKNGNPGQEGYF